MYELFSALEWSDLDPTTHAFDPAVAVRTAGAILPAMSTRDPAEVARLVSAVDRALVAAYGPWAAGWNCSPFWVARVRHSAWVPFAGSLIEGRTGQEAAQRISRRLAVWRATIIELQSLFSEIKERTARLAPARQVEHAASALLPWIIQQTMAEEDWYRTFARTLRWCLSAQGWDPADTRGPIETVLSGRFESWCAPTPDVAAEAFRELGDAIDESEPVQYDALAEWLDVRPRLFGARPPLGGDPVRVDAHRAFIDGPERARDGRRADQMKTALQEVRALARTNTPLDRERLCALAGRVLGTGPAPLRTTTAYGKEGRERYDWSPNFERQFFDHFSQVDNLEPFPAYQATFAYLDVCFFHPFSDGNARLARLVFDYVLTRAGLALPLVEPLFMIARAADDHHGLRALGILISDMVGPIAWTEE